MTTQASDIVAGSQVVAIDAGGREVPMTADSAVEEVGHDFPVVWVRRPLDAGGTDRMPWPADAVRLAT